MTHLTPLPTAIWQMEMERTADSARGVEGLNSGTGSPNTRRLKRLFPDPVTPTRIRRARADSMYPSVIDSFKIFLSSSPVGTYV